ncbi:MAG: pyridine nucleotide-disulfide oxidoreductase family protein [Micavibrio sp.]|nr:pyridine nucleotide-disulfide oxidoreductase family protein [Micavibrio sp.]
MNHYNVMIVGAGAAGLMCAAQALKRGRTVLVADHAKKIGEKIRISGGGRCNFTNLNSSPLQFLSQNEHFCKSALKQYTQYDFIALVDRHGIKWHEKTLGQLFCDDSAQQIITMLRHECDGAKIQTETEILGIEKTETGFHVRTTRGDADCDSLVIATGGPSIPKIGASGFGYKVAAQFGLSVIEPRAGLVPLTFGADLLEMTKNLSGVAVDPAVVQANGASFREALLFTHRGLSGPAILQISSYVLPGQNITVNLAPDVDALSFLKDARISAPRKILHNILSDILPARLAEMIATYSGFDIVMADLSDKKLQIVAAMINAWTIRPQGNEGYRTAEVALGGVDTNELSSKTFEARKMPGLYFIGEVVDVTGWLGGYNFQWAWSSGWCCGQAC